MERNETILSTLHAWFTQLDGAIVALSGGVDSSLVACVARKYLGKDKLVCCIADSPSLKRTDLQEAIDFCKKFDIRIEILNTNEIEDPNYYTNPATRCFACKTHLYQDLSKVQLRYPNFSALNGTNKDDLGDYRPGLQAADNHRILSPLADCGMDKRDIRALARHLGLPNWDKPASPCLSSRIPYGQKVTTDKLAQIENGEEILRRYGFATARLRHFDTTARIEVEEPQIQELRSRWSKIEPALIALGFQHCEIDPEGLVSGKLNRAIVKNA